MPLNLSDDTNRPSQCTPSSGTKLMWKTSGVLETVSKMGNAIRGVIAFIPSERCQRFLVGDLKEMPLDRTLDLSSRQLRRLPVAACVFHELVKLYLSDNNLSSLPIELQGLKKLQLLALDFNCFEELPPAVCRLPQLSILYLGNNRLCHLPRELKELKELNTLWLETNCFTVFPKVVCELSNLKTLHLGYNQIQSLPKELSGLEELRSVWLAGNQLAEFPPVLLEMHFLAVIDVDRNRIRRFPGLSHLHGLKLIIYDHNPCVNAPVVGDGVRRVGRWADSSDDEQEDDGSKAAIESTAEVTEEPEEEHNIKDI
ncbi:Leucine-rich repeat-containing protein 10 Heart-restricted leucine-rich repeat protein [Larimichthys crocea]|uniref:Leucine-rich repeat-containing protein 10 Heart-restricted leucine-rich repeat protein n=1 Tax=Larimichthys crocea TaxID=215358 RepID=A0A6G0IY63_LARCR|nr:leucine-rich repeat-containing protein 10 [Larimichthys crocea]KAE8296465.1 Leucine-rich repeat-containing protein 10 Heart-restricted leucine-rich repeat protein [Larimichthys crocea]